MKNIRITRIAIAIAVLMLSSVVLAACKTPARFTVAFDLNGGAGIAATQTVNNGGTATRPSTDPTKPGHTFVAWSTSAASNIAFDFATPITANRTLYAYYAVGANVTIHTVTFDLNGGTGTVAPQAVVSGQYATAPTNIPTKAGSLFLGWTTTKDDADTTFYFAEESIDQNLTLFALWGESTPSNIVANAAQNTQANIVEIKHSMVRNASNEDYTRTQDIQIKYIDANTPVEAHVVNEAAAKQESWWTPESTLTVASYDGKVTVQKATGLVPLGLESLHILSYLAQVEFEAKAGANNVFVVEQGSETIEVTVANARITKVVSIYEYEGSDYTTEETMTIDYFFNSGNVSIPARPTTFPEGAEIVDMFVVDIVFMVDGAEVDRYISPELELTRDDIEQYASWSFYGELFSVEGVYTDAALTTAATFTNDIFTLTAPTILYIDIAIQTANEYLLAVLEHSIETATSTNLRMIAETDEYGYMDIREVLEFDNGVLVRMEQELDALGMRITQMWSDGELSVIIDYDAPEISAATAEEILEDSTLLITASTLYTLLEGNLVDFTYNGGRFTAEYEGESYTISIYDGKIDWLDVRSEQGSIDLDFTY